VDIFEAYKCGLITAKVKGANTAPEKEVKARLWSKGFRYASADQNLPRRLDIVLPILKSAIFGMGIRVTVVAKEEIKKNVSV
jgi:G:T-mismatch repair DNA endonuclease (very short patch repair protein)